MRRVVDADEALRFFADQPYKRELISNLGAEGDTITTYRQAAAEAGTFSAWLGMG